MLREEQSEQYGEGWIYEKVIFNEVVCPNKCPSENTNILSCFEQCQDPRQKVVSTF